MATVFFLHLTCFDTRRRSTTTTTQKKTKVLAQNVRQSAGVRCGAARQVDSCESGNYRCGVRNWGCLFGNTPQQNSPRCPAQRPAALALSRRRQHWLCLCFAVVVGRAASSTYSTSSSSSAWLVWLWPVLCVVALVTNKQRPQAGRKW